MRIKTVSVWDIIFVVFCVALALTLGIGIYALPREDISAEENRPLAGTPDLSVKKLLNGDFFEEVSDFYSDRMPLRTQMIRVKAVCELALGKGENNGVRFTSGRLVDRCIYDELSVLEENLSDIRSFAEQKGALCAIVPRSADIYTESEEAAAVRSLWKDDGLYLKLRAAGEEAYYKTDHHLDAEGAFAVYEYIMESLGKTPLTRSQFELTSVSDGFLGTVYSRSGLIAPCSDTVSTWRYAEDGELKVSCSDTGCALGRLYVPEELAKKDKYRYFLGGNHGTLTVTSDASDRPDLYIIKDSFANAVIPLLARHFDLTVYDPRYLSVPIDIPTDADCVILCGIDTLATTGRFLKAPIGK